MIYRVAVFKRVGRQMVFEKFAYEGFQILPNGKLYRGKVACNMNDRRGRKYYEIHRKLPRPDRLGQDIYEHDIIFDARFNALCTVLWRDYAFVLAHRQRGFTVQFKFADFRPESVEIVGNEYTNELRQIVAHGMKK